MTGLGGMFFNTQNILLIILSFECMMFGLGICWIEAALLLDDINGLIFAFVHLAMAACETAIGLAILVVYYRFTHSLEFYNIRT